MCFIPFLLPARNTCTVHMKNFGTVKKLYSNRTGGGGGGDAETQQCCPCSRCSCWCLCRQESCRCPSVTRLVLSFGVSYRSGWLQSCYVAKDVLPPSTRYRITCTPLPQFVFGTGSQCSAQVGPHLKIPISSLLQS